MAVAKNDSGTNVVSTASSVATLDLTTFSVSAGSNLLLIGFVFIAGTPGTVTLNWDSAGANQAMTATALSPAANTQRVYMFLLINPVTGNKTMHCAGIGGKPACVGAICFSGADQTTGINAAHSLTLTGTSTANVPTIGPITGSSDGATVAMVGLNGNIIDNIVTQTQIFLDNTAGGNGASYNLGGLSNTHTWSNGHSGPWAMLGIHVIAAAAAAGHGFNRQSLAPGCGVPARKSQRWKRKGMIIVPEEAA